MRASRHSRRALPDISKRFGALPAVSFVFRVFRSTPGIAFYPSTICALFSEVFLPTMTAFRSAGLLWFAFLILAKAE